MTEEELEKRGAQVFARFSNDDKRALKWFITGQIQNILANEHGIGGSKGIRDAVQQKAAERINSLIDNEEFLIKLAERLASSRRIDFAKLITDAATKETQKQVQAAAGFAARRVRVEVSIDPDPNPPGAAPGFAQF